jgi:hypothetical protein
MHGAPELHKYIYGTGELVQYWFNFGIQVFLGSSEINAWMFEVDIEFIKFQIIHCTSIGSLYGIDNICIFCIPF